jgi:ParB-like chromosome segregation protein Spo0J
VQLKDHPISERFPLMPDEELAALAKDIQAHGCKTRITLYEDKILDGRNRYRACLIAGRQALTQNFTGTHAQAVIHALSLNLHRRHLSASQIAAILQLETEPCAGLHKTKHPEITKESEKKNKTDVLAEHAKSAGVSLRSVQLAEAVGKADRKKLEEVADGKKSLETAQKEIKAEAAPKKKLKAADLPVDSRGVPVPADKAEVWGRRDEINELTTMLSKVRVIVKKAYEDHDPIYAHADAQQLGLRLDAIYHELASSKPWCVCPMCQGASCRACKGSGFMGKFAFKMYVPAELKKPDER